MKLGYIYALVLIMGISILSHESSADARGRGGRGWGRGGRSFGLGLAGGVVGASLYNGYGWRRPYYGYGYYDDFYYARPVTYVSTPSTTIVRERDSRNDDLREDKRRLTEDNRRLQDKLDQHEANTRTSRK